jgi:hypothetical protein
MTAGTTNEPKLTSLQEYQQSLREVKESIEQAQKARWRGRLVHEGENAALVPLQILTSIILATLGIIFCRSRPKTGGVLIALSTGLAYKTYRDIQAPNPLKDALKHLTGLEDLNQLFEMKWKTKWGKLQVFKYEDMSQPVMALKTSGKQTIAVAFKYFNEAYTSGDNNPRPRKVIQIFYFQAMFVSSFSEQGDEVFEVKHWLSAEEGKYLEQFMKQLKRYSSFKGDAGYID